MFEAWQFLLARRARLPDTVDFVLYELFSIFAYNCAQRSAVEYQHLISYTRSSKYCRIVLGKMELFRRIVVFRLWIHSGLRKLLVEMAHFKKYSSFSETRYALKWQISVQPLHNIIILIGSKN